MFKPSTAPFARTGSSRGVAMLIVITILVTMVLVALPFALSMQQGQERTRAVGARDRARFEAETLSEIAKLYLSGGHPFQEQQRYDRGERTVDALPWVDGLDEITPNDAFRKKVENEIISLWEKDPAMAERARYLKSRGLGPLNDDRGSIWTVLIQDAQALVNVNGGSPYLLGNLLGSALLADDLDTGGGDIAVEHVVTGRFGGLRGFPADGGFLRIGGEVIKYEEFDGEAFRGCERGVLLDAPLGDNGEAEAHERGTPIIDYTAYKLATHLIARRPGHITPFENLASLRDIASWGEDGILTAARLEGLLPFLTVWSKRESSAEWLADQLVVNELPTSVDGADPDEIQVRDFLNNPAGTTAYVNQGTLIRVTNGVFTAYQTVAKVGDASGRRRDFFFTTSGSVAAGHISEGGEADIKFEGGKTKVAAFAPYPININTAPREVLYAVMANMQLWRAEGKEQVVTPELAWQLAEEIVEARKGAVRSDRDTGRRAGGPFRNAEDFSRFLEEKVRTNEITRAHHAALYLNAINPHSWQLRFGTAPWCYRTLDVYHLEARVALNNRVGEQIAEASVREVVEIGSDTTATWTLDSQDDFEQRIAMGSGAKWVTTYPFSVAYKNRAWHHIQPAVRGPKGFINHVYPSGRRGEDLGDVRLEPGRLLLPGAQIAEHFDQSWYADGHFTGYDGAYTKPVKGTLMGNKETQVRPFSMSLWWRPYSDQDWTVFDTGVDPFTNRIGLFVQDGEQGQELTFRVSAGTLWQQGAEVYVPMDQLDYEPGTWYHLHVSCDGEDPASMQLLVDGVDIGRRRGLTLTSGAVTAESEEISVENTEGFPVRGSIRIGTEIIEYQNVSDTGFRDCVRGARGTTPQDFAANCPVHVNGYTMPITVDVMKGGRHLSERLGKWSALRVSTMNGEPAPDTVAVVINGATTPIILAGFGPDSTNITLSTVGMWGQDDSTGAEAFGEKGIALLGCPRIANASAGSGGPAGPGPEDPPPPAEPPAEGDEGGNHTNPGDGVPPGGRVPPADDGGGTPDVPGPVPTPDAPGGGGDDGTGPAGGGDVPLGGWEVVYYERNGNEFTIERYIDTAWQGSADAYFLITENRTAQTEFPCFLVPISVQADGTSERGDDYLDPGDTSTDHEDRLLRYYGNGDASARVALPVDDGQNEGETEILRYDSIDRNRAQPSILFVRDRNIGQVTSHFFGNSQTIAGGSASDDPGGDDPPVPPPDDDPPVPPPLPGDPGDLPDPTPQPGDTPEEPADPTPGDGVPPGQRDPPTTEPGDPTPDPTPTPNPGPGTDPGTGDEPGTGDDGPTPTGGEGGTADGTEDGDEPTDPFGEDPAEGDPGELGQPEDGGEEDPASEDGNFGGGGDSVSPGARPGGEDSDSGDTGGDGPPDEEPAPDESGGGGENESPEDEEGNAKVPDVVQPGAREPSDPAEGEQSDEVDGDEQGDGEVWEPAGPESARQKLQFRGVNGSVDWEHSGGADENNYFLPCFRAWETFVSAPVARTGRNDVITITDGGEEPTRTEIGIRWGDINSDWACLTDFVDQHFEAPETGANVRRNDPRKRPRIMRFPSGEMPDDFARDLEFGQSQVSGAGLVTAFLDELHVWRHAVDTSLVVNNTDGLSEEQDEIRLVNVGTTQALGSLAGYDPDCGIALIAGELVVYRGSHLEGDRVLILERCARGQFGTRTMFHPVGDPVRFLPDIPVSYLDSGMTASSSTVPLARTRGFPPEGLVRVLREDTAELMHYTRRGQNELIMPVSIDADQRTRDRGLFRGRFGTDATGHDSDEIVVFQPYRYWDRFTPRRGENDESFGGVHDHPETSYLELGTEARGALWRGFTWSENVLGRLTGTSGLEGDENSDASSGYLDIYVAVRFNKNVPWDTQDVIDLRQEQGLGSRTDFASKQNTHVFLFDDTGTESIGQGRNGNEFNVESDTAEFRVYFVYKANAFEPVDAARRGLTGAGEDPILSNYWKQTPWLRAFGVNYFSRTHTLHKAALR